MILATGIHDVHPKVDNLIDLRRRGLLKYCSICDGYEVRDRPVAVLAQDDFGIQKALFIGHWTPHIRIYVPKDMKLAPQRVREIRALGAKVIRCDTLTMEPIESSTGGSPGLCVRADGRKPFACSVAYVELGSRVNDSAFKGLKKLRRSKEGFLITTTEQRTSIPGLFAVGACVNLLGQVSVAAGQAAVAATTIHNDLLEAG